MTKPKRKTKEKTHLDAPEISGHEPSRLAPTGTIASRILDGHYRDLCLAFNPLPYVPYIPKSPMRLQTPAKRKRRKGSTQ